MEVATAPESVLLETEHSLKTLKISAMTGMQAALPQSTKVAVVVLHKRVVHLKLPDAEQVLKKGMTVTIAADVPHSLALKNDLRAVAIMAIDSNIQFH